MDRPKNLIEAIERICEETGAVHAFGPEERAAFLWLTEAQMGGLIRRIIYAQADEINRMVFTKPRRHTEEDLLDLIQNTLSTISMGLCGFDEAGNLVFSKPEGREPSPDVEVMLKKKVADSRPLIRPVFLEVLAEMRTSRRPPAP